MTLNLGSSPSIAHLLEISVPCAFSAIIACALRGLCAMGPTWKVLRMHLATSVYLWAQTDLVQTIADLKTTE